MSNYKKIKGQKILNVEFTNSVIVVTISVALICLCIILGILINMPPLYTFIICAPIGTIGFAFLIALLSVKKTLGILADDRIYYFGATGLSSPCFIQIADKKEQYLHQDGWILYSAISKYEFHPRVRPISSCAILYGNDFELMINNVSKHFIEKLEQAKKACPPTYLEEVYGVITPDTQAARSGLWKEIWDYCESNSLEKVFRCDTIARIDFDASSNTIDIELNNRGQNIFINMDSDSMYISTDDNDTDQTIGYKDLKSLEDLFAIIRNFIDRNS